MKIVVCIKQVPDTTEVKIDPVKGTLIRDGVPSIINPDDMAGLETALQLKLKYDAEVVVISMGPQQAKVALREAIAMGVDRAILVSDRKFGGADTWATSHTLAAAIKKVGYDLIICGRQAIDGDTAQVGPQIAEHLQIPQVSYVAGIEAKDNGVIVRRNFEDRYQRVSIKFPCLITTLKEMNEARYMSVLGIETAFTAEIEEWGFADLDVDPAEIGLKGSPTKVRKSFTKQGKTTGVKHEVSPEESAELIINKMKEKFIIR